MRLAFHFVICFLHTISSLIGIIATDGLPDHATIRLEIVVHGQAVAGKDKDVEQVIMQRLHMINKNLKHGLGIHVQFSGWSKTAVSPTPGMKLEEYARRLPSGTGASTFRMFWTRHPFDQPFYTSTPGNGCSPDGHSVVVLSPDVPESTRNMERALLMNLGIVGSGTCSCKDCILDPNSKSMTIPQCARQVFLRNLKVYNLRCVTDAPDGRASRLPLCGNGLVEGREQCDCHAGDGGCSKCCIEISCTRRESCPIPHMKPILPQSPNPGHTPPKRFPGPNPPPPNTVGTNVSQDGGKPFANETQTVAGRKAENDGNDNSKWYIICGVGVVVILMLVVAAVIAVKLVRKKKSSVRPEGVKSGKSPDRSKSSKWKKVPKDKPKILSKRSRLSNLSASSVVPSGGATEFFA